MRRLAAVALMVVGISLPVCAQRGRSRGGFSGHGGAGIHGGLSASASRFAGSPRSAGRPVNMARSPQRSGAGGAGARSPYTGDRRKRRPYISPYRRRNGYGYPGWVSPYLPGYPGGLGYDDSGDAGNAPSVADSGQQDELEQPEPYQPVPELPGPPQVLGSEGAVTLVFKDGRTPEQIHNYLLTRTTLYVQDQKRRDIPTDELDLVATAKVNQDAGVDFHLPNAPR